MEESLREDMGHSGPQAYTKSKKFFIHMLWREKTPFARPHAMETTRDLLGHSLRLLPVRRMQRAQQSLPQR